MAVASLNEWLQLPEITCPVIRDHANSGSRYLVYKVGFIGVPQTQCGDLDVSEAACEAGRHFFPIADAEFGKERRTCRLPLQLGDWAIDSVAMAKQLGKSPFPMRVEFGVLDGRYYAEML